MSARAASSSSTTSAHRFPWKWRLADLPRVRKHGLTVFSCFACGGGSSMGYKLAGYDVLGNCEIDPRIAKVYARNLHPKHSFIMDVRDFLKLPDADIPPELFSLDVLDGSPPCSTFSMAGDREAAWGKQKVFAEGQKKQRLDDLFFTFIAIAARLRPKVVIAENVKGLLVGNARGYVHEIVGGFRDAGYDVQIFLLDASCMGVPQRRERVFFIARRKDLWLPAVKLSFREPPILFGEVRTPEGRPFRKAGGKFEAALKLRRPEDKSAADIFKRLGMKPCGHTNLVVGDGDVCPTLLANPPFYRHCDGRGFTDGDHAAVSSFPRDYDFSGADSRFVCGMSVPPVMAAQVGAAVAEQCLGVPAPAGGIGAGDVQGGPSGGSLSIGGEGKLEALVRNRRPGDTCLADVCARLGLKRVGFTRRIVEDGVVSPALVAANYDYRFCDGMYMSDGDLRNVSSFPQDYQFGRESALFLCGMSVPPVMAAQVGAAVAEQCLGVPAPAGGLQ